MAKEYYTIATFRSSSRGSLWHRVNKDEAGNLSCTCPGWCRRVASDGSRSCKHVRKVMEKKAGLAEVAPLRGTSGKEANQKTVLGQRRFRL